MTNPTEDKDRFDLSDMPYNPDLYWIKATDDKGRVLYQSALTHYTDIPSSGKKETYMIERVIPRSQIRLEQDDNDDVLFRVMVIKAEIDGVPIEVRIAKPIEKLEEELLELVRHILVSLALCTLIIVLVSYKLAGKILTPVSDITRMAKEISEKSLYKRIPLEGNRDELQDLAVSLNKMFDRLQYSFKRQKEFIGNASHELKSPITLLMLSQEEMLMNDGLPGPANITLKKQLDTTRRMSHLVRNLLDLFRLEQQETLDKKPVNLTALIARILNDHADLLTAKSVKIENKLPKDLPFSGDSEKLFRLFINLIDNSIRYNFEKEGIIIIKGEKTDKELLLEISNTGRPIPEADISLVFEQFYRVEKSRSITHGGSGLGLTIVKKIVELHDGTIHISNEPDQFIKVSVCFPFAC
ncbi:MAG: HAMP domain-containing sensor histidine kinase [Desulfobacula sp.]